MLVDLIIIVLVALVAYYIITKFFPAEVQMIALIIVGIVLLLWLLNTVGLIDHKLIN